MVMLRLSQRSMKTENKWKPLNVMTNPETFAGAGMDSFKGQRGMELDFRVFIIMKQVLVIY